MNPTIIQLILLLVGVFFLGLLVGYTFCLIKLEKIYKQTLDQIHERYHNKWEMEFGIPKPRTNKSSNVIDIRSKKGRKIFRTYENKDN